MSHVRGFGSLLLALLLPTLAVASAAPLAEGGPATLAVLEGSVVAIAAGWRHSPALREDGTVWAWGDNQESILIPVPETKILTPFQVGGLESIVAIAGGFRYSLALKGDGTLWAWGANDSGQLGNGSVSDYLTTSPIPAPVSGLSGVIAIAASRAHSLAVTSDGSVWAWGSNTAGELGNGTRGDSALPVQVSGMTGAIAVSAGDDFSLALKSDGTVLEWGDEETTTPTQVAGIGEVTAIAAGEKHTLALRGD